MHTRHHFYVLLSALILCAGCETPLGTNPLQGWKCVGNAFTVDETKTRCPFDEMICADFQAYVQTLSASQRYSARFANFYEDSTGQRAVAFDEPHDGIHWMHVLIYDQTGKRTKFIKYASGRYRC